MRACNSRSSLHPFIAAPVSSLFISPPPPSSLSAYNMPTQGQVWPLSTAGAMIYKGPWSFNMEAIFLMAARENDPDPSAADVVLVKTTMSNGLRICSGDSAGRKEGEAQMLAGGPLPNHLKYAEEEYRGLEGPRRFEGSVDKTPGSD